MIDRLGRINNGRPKLQDGKTRDSHGDVIRVLDHDEPSRISVRGRRCEGRPTKYRTRFVNQLLQAARDGLSLTAFAGQIEVRLDTLWDWGHRYPEFSAAIQKAKAMRTTKWEKIAVGIADGTLPYAGTAMTIFALKNVAPEEWREKTVVEHDISDRVADRLDAARLRMLGQLAAPTVIEGVAEEVSAIEPSKPRASDE